MPIESQRMRYQRMFAKGRIVNLGCGENPCNFDEDVVHVDIDTYNHKNFVQADIHHLPFKDNEFDTAVLGDVLEHSPDPVQMLREAGRVAKKVVATVFEEWRIDGGAPEMIDRMKRDEKVMGFDNHLSYLKSLPTVKDKIVSVTDDSIISHHPHIQQFTDKNLKKIIDDAGLEVIIFHKFQEGIHEGRIWYNWLIIAQKKK